MIKLIYCFYNVFFCNLKDKYIVFVYMFYYVGIVWYNYLWKEKKSVIYFVINLGRLCYSCKKIVL